MFATAAAPVEIPRYRAPSAARIALLLACAPHLPYTGTFMRYSYASSFTYRFWGYPGIG
jgi:hypothetical protein